MEMRIQELREKAGLTQTQLGACMGVAQNAISQWEREVSLPKTRQLPVLAQVLGCSVGELFAVSEVETEDSV